MIKQDRIWAELERDDPRQIEIIELTGHHEFGTQQVMANVGDPEMLHEIRRLFDAGQVGAIARPLLGLRLRIRCQAAADDPQLRARVCIVRYEDLCGDSLGDDRPHPRARRARRREAFAAARETYGKKLSFPDYYKPKFDEPTMRAIIAATDGVAKRFGYDVADIAQRVGVAPPEATSV